MHNIYTVSLLYTTVISSFTSFLKPPGWSVAETRVLLRAAPRHLIDRAPGNDATSFTSIQCIYTLNPVESKYRDGPTGHKKFHSNNMHIFSVEWWLHSTQYYMYIHYIVQYSVYKSCYDAVHIIYTHMYIIIYRIWRLTSKVLTAHFLPHPVVYFWMLFTTLENNALTSGTGNTQLCLVLYEFLDPIPRAIFPVQHSHQCFIYIDVHVRTCICRCIYMYIMYIYIHTL